MPAKPLAWTPPLLPVPDHLFPILAVVAVAGLIQGLAGFGSALVAVPLLALLMPVERVVPLMMLIGILLSSLNLLHLRHALRFRPLAPLLAGYAFGTPVGLLLLTQAPQALVLGLLGLCIGGYALFSLVGRQPRYPWLRNNRLMVGLLSGALGAAFGTNGPPVILHVSAHTDWDADRQKALLTLFFLVSGVITATALAIGGLMTSAVMGLLPWCLPALLAGSLAGVALYRRLGAHDYRRLVFSLVLGTAVVLILRALSLLG
jgi:hypothetical protein